MNKLPKEKRDLLIGIAFGTVAAIVALWFLVATEQKKSLLVLEHKAQELIDTLTKATEVQKTGKDVAAQLEARKAELATRESGLVPDRERYLWMVTAINKFISQRKNVNIASFNQPTVGPETLVTRSTYQTATYRIKGLGYFHDFGKFFADFENTYPYFRIQNWDIAPAGGGAGSEGEKLSVSFDLIAPIMPPSGEAAK